MLLHSPELAKRILPLVSFFRDDSVVEAPLRSVAILAAVREREAAYVWSAQVASTCASSCARTAWSRPCSTRAANYFAMLSGMVNAFEVAAPADGDKLPV
jgi:hypothetical protein